MRQSKAKIHLTLLSIHSHEVLCPAIGRRFVDHAGSMSHGMAAGRRAENVNRRQGISAVAKK